MRSAFVPVALLTLLSLGCAISNYPVILDSRGPWGDSVLDGQYEQAYIIPETQIATIFSDGSDELYTLVSQDWKGDQWLYTYGNNDPTATTIFLDQTYCDPNRQTQCAIQASWNPDLPDTLEWNKPGFDTIFDYAYFDPSCSGARSLSDMVSYSTRLGECGSSFRADRQNLAYEFSMLERTTFRGEDVYEVPLDASKTSYLLTAMDGAAESAPIYGRATVYLDDKLRLIWPVEPNQRYMARWRNRFIDAHGAVAGVDVTYGSIRAHYEVMLSYLDESRF